MKKFEHMTKMISRMEVLFFAQQSIIHVFCMRLKGSFLGWLWKLCMAINN